MHLKDIFVILLMTLSFNAFAVTNQELMDRLDDIESAQQQREMDRLLDRQLQEYIKQSSQLPYAPTQTVQPKTSKYQDSSSCGVIWRGGSFNNIEKATINDAISSAYKNKSILRASTRKYVESLYPKLIEADKRGRTNEARSLANEIRNNSITFLYPKDVKEDELKSVLTNPKIGFFCP